MRQMWCEHIRLSAQYYPLSGYWRQMYAILQVKGDEHLTLLQDCVMIGDLICTEKTSNEKVRCSVLC